MRLLAALVLLASLSLLSCGGDKPAPAAEAPTIAPRATADPTATASGVVTIAAVGDIMLARDLTTLMEQHGAGYPYERVADLLQNADLTIANMEGTFTERGVAQDKLYTFRTPPRFARGLADAGIDVVSLGNNHTADFGPEGVEDTLAALDAASIPHSGAGMDAVSARRPAFVDVNGVRLAFLSYTDVMENTFAEAASAGVALATAEVIEQGVRAARMQADVVVVSLHSGVEYTDAPQLTQVQLAHAAIDAGARLVIGHHSHVLQGWERYGGGIIIYSLGNFVFDLDGDDLTQLGPRPFESVIAYITVDGSGVQSTRVEPVFIDPAEDRPRPATPDEAAAIHQRLMELDALVPQ